MAAMARDEMSRSSSAGVYIKPIASVALELPSPIEQLEAGLLKIIESGGLPLTRANTSLLLLTYVGFFHVPAVVKANSYDLVVELTSDYNVDHYISELEKQIRDCLDDFDDEKLAEAARIYFGATKRYRGANKTEKESAIAENLGVSEQTVRKSRRDKIVAVLAHQIYMSNRNQ